MKKKMGKGLASKMKATGMKKPPKGALPPQKSKKGMSIKESPKALIGKLSKVKF